MVTVIVDQGEPALHLAVALEAPADAVKLGERLLDELVLRPSSVPTAIAASALSVVPARQIEHYVERLRIPAQYAKAHAPAVVPMPSARTETASPVP